MTHDELVKFAAGKVGGKVEITYSGLVVMVDYVMYAITSPDLMLKGMGVCGYDVAISIGQADYEKAVCFMEGSRHEVWKFYRKPSDIPETFWTAWAELEGG